MKRLVLSAILVMAACVAPSAHAAGPVTVLLVGGANEDVLDVKLSQDGRDYLVTSLSPLEADGSICTRVEGALNRLSCRAVAIAGFEVNAGAGDDSVFISPRIFIPTTLRGGSGNDRLRGGSGDDKILGGGGQDILLGMQGRDWIFGGPGEDSLYGGGGDDRLVGGPDPDYFNGGPGANTTDAGPKDKTELSMR